MRRGYALILLVSALGSWAPSALGQYPYPYAPQPSYGYGPMPAQYMPPQPYGPMPPAGYYPPPMPAQQPPRVFVYGPLTAAPPDPTAPLLPGPGRVQPGTAKGAPTKAFNANDPKAIVSQAQLTLPPAGAKDAPSAAPIHVAPDACGPGCDDGFCAPTPIYNFIPKDPPMPGHGHFIGDVGALFVVPYLNPHTSYQTFNAGGTGAITEFPRQADFGPAVNFGYITHSGWGVRAGYWYLHGNINETLANTDPTLNIQTPPIGGLQLAGPSLALANGIGTDQYHFAQQLDLQVADLAVVKEHQFLDTTFLFGAGARYVHFQQAYSATRINAGGFDPTGLNAVTFDRADFSSVSRYEGWGPTVSLELVHPIWGNYVSFYTNLRASFLWGTENFQQNSRVQERSTIGGVTTFLDNQAAAAQLINRQIEVGEVEVGLQYGTRLGRRVYLYGRTGLIVQRWFNVGNPTANNGNVEFFGGTAKVGISF